MKIPMQQRARLYELLDFISRETEFETLRQDLMVLKALLDDVPFEFCEQAGEA